MRYVFPIAVSCALLILSSCVTTRAEYRAEDVETVLEEDFSGALYGWDITGHGESAFDYERGASGETSFLRLRGSNGGAYLNGSTLHNFRMEFDLRLEEAVAHDAAQAMINVRNYFNKRYTLLIEEEMVELAEAKVEHHKLQRVKDIETRQRRGRWYHWEIVCYENNIKVFREGRLLFDYTDADEPIRRGNIWFETHNQYAITNVRVYKIAGFHKLDASGGAAPREGDEPTEPQERVGIAVAAFENHGASLHEVALITDLFVHSLLETRRFKVLERKELKKVLEEQKKQLSGLTEAQEMVEVGNLLNARYIASGSVGALGDGFVLTVKIIEIESGETLLALNTQTDNSAEIPERLDELSAELAEGMQDI